MYLPLTTFVAAALPALKWHNCAGFLLSGNQATGHGRAELHQRANGISDKFIGNQSAYRHHEAKRQQESHVGELLQAASAGRIMRSQGQIGE